MKEKDLRQSELPIDPNSLEHLRQLQEFGYVSIVNHFRGHIGGRSGLFHCFISNVSYNKEPLERAIKQAIQNREKYKEFLE